MYIHICDIYIYIYTYMSYIAIYLSIIIYSIYISVARQFQFILNDRYNKDHSTIFYYYITGFLGAHLSVHPSVHPFIHLSIISDG